MWARKRIDIGYLDLFRALGYCILPMIRSTSESQIRDSFPNKNIFVCLSVRSGFDLLLQCLDWKEGSEVIFSGLTIADMPKIANAHGLKAVGVDLSLETLEPRLDEIESKITPQTKAIVVAHLMGSRCELNEIADLARRHGLLLIEDCAQAYIGNHWTGSAGAHVSMFSFGSIKTNSSLGGSLFFVADDNLLEQIQRKHRSWPFQSRYSFAKRVLKYGFIKLISARWFVWVLCFVLKKLRLQHDEIFSKMTRGFSGPDFFDRIRHQPSLPLISLLSKRIAHFRPLSIQKRAERGEKLAELLDLRCLIPASQAIARTHWVFPILVENPSEVTQTLWKHGFDATAKSSLSSVSNSNFNKSFLEQVVFLPIDPPMPAHEVSRMASIINQVANPAFTQDWPAVVRQGRPKSSRDEQESH